jgi:hypothetical protein
MENEEIQIEKRNENKENNSTKEIQNKRQLIYQYNTIVAAILVTLVSIIVSLIGMAKGLIEPYVALFDLAIGIIMLLIVGLIYINKNSGVGAFFQVLNLGVVIYLFSSNVIFPPNIEKFWPLFPGYIVFAFILTIWFLFWALCGLIDSLLSVVQFFKKKSNNTFNWDKKAGKKSIILLLIVLPFTLFFTPVYQPTITLTFEEDFDVKFNFWQGCTFLDENMTGELNEHQVNIEIGHPIIDGLSFKTSRTNLTALQKMEQQMPNVTYRFVIGGAVTQKNTLSVLETVKTDGEILISATENKTIKNWRGFTCDIEGRIDLDRTEFRDSQVYLNEMFDWLAIRAPWVEMTSVGEINYAMDWNFDGDDDLQMARGLPAYTPERWDLYAPMLYRCWYEGPIPYGTPQDLDATYPTAFYTYSELSRFSNSVPKNKLGVYLGITNCSCYGRDMVVDDNGATNGYEALIQDARICKAFGIREITFFLLGSCMERDYSMGGVFDSYGVGFLDTMNESLNGANSDTPIKIKYNAESVSNPSATNSWYLQQDLLYNFNRWSYLVISSAILILGLVFLMQKKDDNASIEKSELIPNESAV